jgi:hypothetical protein
MWKAAHEYIVEELVLPFLDQLLHEAVEQLMRIDDFTHRNTTLVSEKLL